MTSLDQGDAVDSLNDRKSASRLARLGAWFNGWKVEPRLEVGLGRESLGLSVGLIASFGVCGLLIMLAGSNMFTAYGSLLSGSFGSKYAIYETLVQATPLILTGLTATVAFRARIWNIGGEGQFFAGTMGAFWVGNQWGESLGSGVIIPLLIVGAACTGAIWGAIPGILKARYETNEIITTVMMNFLIIYIMSYLLGGPWRAPDTYYFQTSRLPQSTYIPKIFSGSRLHWGFVIAVGFLLLIWWLINSTTFGFEIRALGVNRLAAGYAGIGVPKTTVLVMAVSGALAGVAGGVEVAALHHRLTMDMNTAGYGFAGIIIALLARLKPWAVIIAAIGFGGLRNGAVNMQISTGIPEALVSVVQGLTLLFVLIFAIAVRYEFRRTDTSEA
jgi:ABC-type uncharacterized transport system permease subunit